MNRSCIRPRLAVLALALVMPWALARAGELYATDFAEFPLGDDKLVGTGGWLGTNKGEGVHGVDDSAIPRLGKAAFLGFNPPSTNYVTVYRPLEAQKVPPVGAIVEFTTTLAVADSSNGGFDRFLITVYNTEDDFLAAVLLDNTLVDFGIWASDGDFDTDTSVAYETDVLFDLRVVIDLARNKWSAYMDGGVVFKDWTFTASTVRRDLGGIAAEWEIVNTRRPGDNWLLFDNWKIASAEALPPAAIPAQWASYERFGKDFVLRWNLPANQAYQVEYSLDLKSWLSDLPGSKIPASGAPREITFTDVAPSTPRRFYRLNAAK